MRRNLPGRSLCSRLGKNPITPNQLIKVEKFLKPISKSVKVNVASKIVWDVISKPNNLELYHPFCESNPVEKWSGKESIDHVNYYNGIKFKRIFTDWIEGQGYDLLIGKERGRKSKVVWRIDKTDDSVSELKITIHPHNISRYTRIINSVIYILYIKPKLRSYLDSVLKGFKMYIIEGNPVRKNQFGSHRWFSN